jgi:hypothetical protein
VGFEGLFVDEAAGDTERLFGVVGDRPGRLTPRPVGHHLRQAAVFGGDRVRRLELHWPTECVTTGES